MIRGQSQKWDVDRRHVGTGCDIDNMFVWVGWGTNGMEW